jgi:hypothetical protein
MLLENTEYKGYRLKRRKTKKRMRARFYLQLVKTNPEKTPICLQYINTTNIKPPVL